MKKLRISLVVFVLALCATLTACGQDPNEVRKDAQYALELDEVFVCSQRFADNELLVINFDATNNTEEYADMFSVLWKVEVTVDGKTLPDGYLSSDNPYYIDYNSKIAPGESKVIQKVLEMVDVDEDAEIAIKGFAYTMKKKPTEVLIIDETVDMSTVEKKESKSDYEIELDEYYVTVDDDGNPIIVIDMTFTNNSKENASCKSVLRAEAFSGTKEAKTAWIPYNHPLKESNPEDDYAEIRPDSSIAVRYVYEINDEDEDFEFKLYDAKSFDYKCIYENDFDLEDGEEIDLSSKFKFEEDTTIIGFNRDDVVVLCVGDFTNNSDETLTLSSALKSEAFQGGKELSGAYIYSLNDYDYSFKDIQPGTTVPVFFAFKVVDAKDSIVITLTDRRGFGEEVVFEKEYTIDELINNTKKSADKYLDKEIDNSDEMDF